MAGETDWLSRGEGKRPRAAWSFATEAPLVALACARETGETLAADEAGGLYRLDRHGKLANVTHGPSPIRGLAWSDTGGGGIALIGEEKLYWFDRQLTFQGWIEQTEPILSVALEAHGMYAAANLASCSTVLYDANRKQVRRFRSVQPLKTVEFLIHKPALVAVTEFGMLVSLDFQGESLWQQQLFAHVGDLSITGDGQKILLASYTHGIKCHDEHGSQIGSYQMGGTIFKVSSSYDGRRMAAATTEHFFYYMNSDGQILWRTILPEDVCRLHCDPLGTAVVVGLQSGRIARLEWA
jgi:hypothetical protein